MTEEQYERIHDFKESSAGHFSRRDFLRISGYGLFVFFAPKTFGALGAPQSGRDYPTDFNAYLKIGNNDVVFTCHTLGFENGFHQRFRARCFRVHKERRHLDPIPKTNSVDVIACDIEKLTQRYSRVDDIGTRQVDLPEDVVDLAREAKRRHTQCRGGDAAAIDGLLEVLHVDVHEVAEKR